MSLPRFNWQPAPQLSFAGVGSSGGSAGAISIAGTIRIINSATGTQSASAGLLSTYVFSMMGGGYAATNGGGGNKEAAGEVRGITHKLTREASDQLREDARNIWQQLTGRRAVWDDLEVHHRIPLEWSHIFGKADPNRVSNLVGINGKIHRQVSDDWAAWKRSLNGRTPTQAEIMQQALKIDELFKNHWVFPR